MPENLKNVDQREVAKSYGNILGKYHIENEYVDSLISRKGWSYLENVKRDTHVSSVLRTRRQKLLKNEWDIIPASEDPKDIEIAAYCKWALRQLGNRTSCFEDKVESMMSGVFWGFSLEEKIWKRIAGGKNDGKVILTNLKHKPAKEFQFEIDEYGNVKFVKYRNSFAADNFLSYDKFVHTSWGEDADNPYGEPSGAKVAFWQWLKKNGSQFWAIFLEKFGMPTIAATVPNSAKTEDIQVIDEFIQDFQSRTGVKLPEGFDIELLEATRSGTADYKGFVEFCNREISKEILGATLVADEGDKSGGSYAMGTVHSNTLADYTHFDAVKISAAITKQILRPLVDFNFDVDDYPTFAFPTMINPTIFGQNLGDYIKAGMKIPIWWLHKHFGIPMAREGEGIAMPFDKNGPDAKGITNTPAQIFAETDPNPLKDLLDSRLDLMQQIENVYAAQGAEAIGQIFDKVLEKLEEELTPGEAVEKLPGFPVNVNKLQSSLLKAGVVSHLSGRKFAFDALKAKKSQEFAETELPWANDPYKYFSALGIIDKSGYEALETTLKDRYFTVAGLVKNDIEAIFNEASLGLRDGWVWDDFYAAVQNKKIKYIGPVWNNAAGDNVDIGHLRLVYRNAVSRAYSDGAENFWKDPDIQDELWGFRYETAGDDAVRPDHAKYDGLTRPKDDPVWKRLTPPIAHACRCIKVPVLVDEIKAGQEKNTTKLPDLPAEGTF
jgi:SPP1 gp7 family putative phage head morphogenesis protein